MLFFNIDLHSSFNQMALDGDSQNLSAFITPKVFYKWKDCPWARFQRQEFSEIMGLNTERTLPMPFVLEYLIDIMNLNFITYVLLEAQAKSWNMLNWLKKRNTL